MMIWSIETFLYANIIIILASILQMATGVSVGMIIVTFLAMISYTLVPTPIILAYLVLTISMAYKGRKNIDTNNLVQINFGMIIGILIAVFILLNLHFKYFGLIFGIFILISVFISLKIKDINLSKNMGLFAGFIAGLMGAISAVGGQVLALIYQNHKVEQIKATLAFIYTIFSSIMLIIFYIFDKFHYEDVVSGLYMMPGFIIGFFLAPFFTKYFKSNYTKTIVLSMASIGAIILIMKSFFAIT